MEMRLIQNIKKLSKQKQSKNKNKILKTGNSNIWIV